MNFRSSLTALIALSIPAISASAQNSVEYQFEFVAEWSAQTHPTAFPGNPHFSPVIGTTHNNQVNIWEPNGIATPGIELMAETGSPVSLQNEINSIISSNNADQFLNFGGIGTSPNSLARTFSVDDEYTLLSLVTMIAPSPDWFVGIHDVELRPNGIWERELFFSLDPYDSGTDAGVSYTSPNSNVTPHLPIANIADEFPFTGSGRIGTFRVTLISDAACSHADFAEPYNQLDFFDVSAFVSAYASQDLSADLNNDGSFDFFDVSSFVNTYAAGCP